MENISKHITYGEAVTSITAKSKGISNIPSADVLENMKHVAENIFEKVREHFAKPIKVSSFFRSAALNKAIGGSATSQHVLGEAMDMDGDVYGSPSNKEIFEYIKANLVFDQIIVEGIQDGMIAWVHVSLKRKGTNRKQILFMYKNDKGETIYENFSETRYKKLIK